MRVCTSTLLSCLGDYSTRASPSIHYQTIGWNDDTALKVKCQEKNASIFDPISKSNNYAENG
jgi:hypothetical protein